MAQKHTAGLKFGPRIWVPLLALLAAALSWQILGLVPKWIENMVVRSFLEKGLVLSTFPVEEIGFSRGTIGRGALVFGTNVIEWDSIRVDYRARDLFSGKLNRISLQDSSVTLRLPVPSLARPAVAEGGAIATDRPAPPAADSAEPIPQAPPPLTATRPAADEPGSLWKQLQELPFNALVLTDGLLDLKLLEEDLLRMDLDAHLDRQPYGVSGELVLEAAGSAAQVSLRAPVKEPVVTLQGEALMREGAIREISEQFLAERETKIPGVVSSGPLRFDFIADFPQGALPYGSGELSLEHLAIGDSRWPGDLEFRNLVVAGIYRDQSLSFHGGVKTFLPATDAFRADPFGLRVSYDSSAGLALESETIPWQFKDLSGRVALRGSAGGGDTRAGKPVRLECAFSAISGEAMQVEPFAVLFEGGADRLSVEASPVGLRRTGVLWLEDLSAYWDFATRSGSGGFSWYDTAGRPAGFFEAALSAADPAGHEMTLSLMDEDRERFFSIAGTFGEQHRLQGAGTLSLDWLNAIGKWNGALPTWRGDADPVLEFQFSGVSPYYKGTASLQCRDLTAEFADGLLVEGIRATVDLDINGLPRTRGPQQAHARLMRSGSFELHDLVLDWQMATWRDIRIKGLTAHVAGGRLRVEPFTIDPLEPDFETVIHFEAINANWILQWLGESRFDISGKVSGTLSIGYRKGVLVLGRGILSMDGTEAPGRFAFEDPEFLRQRFASMAGVPPELRDRFLQTLLEQGIRIHSLQAEFGPGKEPGQLLLRLSISGEARGEQLELPIRGFVINNLISAADLARLLGILGGLRVEALP